MTANHIESVVHEHLSNATQFAGMLNGASFRQQPFDWMASLCQRCEANLDGLRIAGDYAIAMAREALPDDPEIAAVLAILLTESDGNQPGAAQQAIELLTNESAEIRRNAWWGLRLASPRHLGPPLQTLLRVPEWTFPSAAAFDILAFHRIAVRGRIELPSGEDGDIPWLLVEGVGRSSVEWTAAHLKQFAAHPSARVREAAFRASARRGLPGLAAFCEEAFNPEAVEFLGVVGSARDLPLLQRAAKSAVNGLGRLGLPSAIPFLLELLTASELAEASASAIERITGMKVPRGDPPPPPPGMSEDERDLWEPPRPVDPPAARDWWRANSSRFDMEERWQAGLPVSSDPLGPVFDRLPLAIRYDIYLRQRALSPATPDWELDTWTWRQRTGRLLY